MKLNNPSSSLLCDWLAHDHIHFTSFEAECREAMKAHGRWSRLESKAWPTAPDLTVRVLRAHFGWGLEAAWHLPGARVHLEHLRARARLIFIPMELPVTLEKGITGYPIEKVIGLPFIPRKPYLISDVRPVLAGAGCEIGFMVGTD